MKNLLCTVLLSACCLSLPVSAGTSEAVMKEVQRYIDAGYQAHKEENPRGFAENFLKATQVKGLVNPERRMVDQAAIVVLTQMGFFDAAVPSIEREAAQGNLGCQGMMGFVYYCGMGGKPQNREKGIAMMRKAAQLGEPFSQKALTKLGLRW